MAGRVVARCKGRRELLRLEANAAGVGDMYAAIVGLLLHRDIGEKGHLFVAGFVVGESDCDLALGTRPIIAQYYA